MEPQGVPVRHSVVRIIGLGVAALALAGGVVVGLAGPASACSCASAGARDHVRHADVIVTGTLTDMQEPARDAIVSSADPITYTVEVERVFKGEPQREIGFTSAMTGASCGLEGMRVSRRYTFFLTADGSGLTANLCGGTGPADRDLERRIISSTEPPATPPGHTSPAAARTTEDFPAGSAARFHPWLWPLAVAWWDWVDNW